MSTPRKVVLLLATALLHLVLYEAVNEINSRRPDAHLWNLLTPLDAAVPYLSWTWLVYYLGTVGTIPGASYVLWRLHDHAFRRGLRTFCVMIVAGAVVQLLLPARAPWPTATPPLQAWVHSVSKPFANLPSMHVALAMLTGLLGFATLRRTAGAVYLTVGALISISTVTMKEHYVLDLIAGLALSVICYRYWAHAADSHT